MKLHEEYDAVQRQLVVAADREAAWPLISEPRELEQWLADEVSLAEIAEGAAGEVRVDGLRRTTVVDEVEPGRRVSLRWWPAGGEERDATLVELTLDDVPDGTRVSVVELPVRALVVAGERIGSLPASAPRGPQMAGAPA